jgi:hypothetical protein
MKRYLNIPLAVVILAIALIVSAHAQTSGAPRVIAKIPFSFIVGKTALPPGKYTVTVLNPTSDRKTLQIRSMDGRSSAIVLTTNVVGHVSDDAKLVFERYGDRYFFAEAQMAGDSTGLAALRNKTERNKAMARAGKKSVVVIVGG